MPEIRNHRAYRELVEPHKRVHASGRAALEALEAGDRRTAFAQLAELEDASKQVLTLLDQMAEALDAELKHADNRSLTRRNIDKVSATGRNDRHHSAIQIENISEGGLGIAAADAGEVGETIQVELNGEVVLGEIVWKKNGKAGIRLLKGRLTL